MPESSKSTDFTRVVKIYFKLGWSDRTFASHSIGGKEDWWMEERERIGLWIRGGGSPLLDVAREEWKRVVRIGCCCPWMAWFDGPPLRCSAYDSGRHVNPTLSLDKPSAIKSPGFAHPSTPPFFLATVCIFRGERHDDDMRRQCRQKSKQTIPALPRSAIIHTLRHTPPPMSTPRLLWSPPRNYSPPLLPC